MFANSNPPADNLKPRRSVMFQLNASALVAMKFPEYPQYTRDAVEPVRNAPGPKAMQPKPRAKLQ
jgi:hypothetical protein